MDSREVSQQMGRTREVFNGREFARKRLAVHIPQAFNAHTKNPARGFVSSANQHPVDENYPYYVFNDGYETYRNG